jgi:hypothetical protein
MDKAIAKVNQNEFNRYENLFNTAYVVSQNILPFTDYWVADPSETNSPPEEISIQLETLEKTEVENKNNHHNTKDDNSYFYNVL